MCNALKVKEASLNLIRHSMGSQWSCLRGSVDLDVSEEERDECSCNCVLCSLKTSYMFLRITKLHGIGKNTKNRPLIIVCMRTNYKRNYHNIEY